MIPSNIIKIKKMPINQNGKINKNKLILIAHKNYKLN